MPNAPPLTSIDPTDRCPGAPPIKPPDTFLKNIAHLSELTTDRLSLTAHSLASELPNSEVRYLQALEALATLLSHHASSRVVVAAILLPGSLKVYFCCEHTPTVQARAAIGNIPVVINSPDWSYDEKLEILCLGIRQKRSQAKRIMDSFEVYRKKAGVHLTLELNEVIAADSRRDLGEHAELALTEYLFQRGASRVDLGTPKKRGVCFTCETWFKELMSVCPELGVRCWTHSGVCVANGELPEWMMQRDGEGTRENTCFQEVVVRNVEAAIEEYINQVERVFKAEESSDEESDGSSSDNDGSNNQQAETLG